ncbi:MAG: cysteine desulfurase [Desulfovibrio sp.]|jgi:cysteine desulfurase/selenocysteine lyase|nr:cysteine desulfurase [Desulfovibrio sp.]
MITNRYLALDPKAYGLPDAEELRTLLAAYSPEFSPGAPDKERIPGRGKASYGERPPGGERVLGGEQATDGERIPYGERVPGGERATDGAYAPRVVPLSARTPAGAPENPYPVPAADLFAPSARVGNVPVEKIRADFPILEEKVSGHRLVWLDNAATTQKPRRVIERLEHYYRHENSNVHRGAHTLAERSTEAYEGAREKIARFIGAPDSDNIVFVRGTTEGINLVAQAYVKQFLRPGDEIILTVLEHHANIVPWQLLAEESGAVLRVAPVDDDGQIILSAYADLFNSRTRFVSASHVSNALGTVAPVEEMIALAHSHGTRICIDGAQSVSHMPVDMRAMDADFFVFSGHKIYGPTGIGVVYGKADVLEAARPYQGGGNMIADVTFAETVYREAPAKFEAGTGSIADAVGLGEAVDYVSSIGMQHIAAYEQELLAYGTKALSAVPGLTLIGTAARKASVLSFVSAGHSLEEVGKRLSAAGIAVRAGHHCAQPALRRFGLEGTVRPSLAFYNTREEIDLLADVLSKIAGGKARP